MADSSSIGIWRGICPRRAYPTTLYNQTYALFCLSSNPSHCFLFPSSESRFARIPPLHHVYVHDHVQVRHAALRLRPRPLPPRRGFSSPACRSRCLRAPSEEPEGWRCLARRLQAERHLVSGHFPSGQVRSLMPSWSRDTSDAPEHITNTKGTIVLAKNGRLDISMCFLSFAVSEQLVQRIRVQTTPLRRTSPSLMAIMRSPSPPSTPAMTTPSSVSAQDTCSCSG